MERWHKHVDQIAFCIAVNELKIPIRILDNGWNYPCHLKVSPLIAEPWVLHHHADLVFGKLQMPTHDPILQRSIIRVNDAISRFNKLHNFNSN